MDFAYHYTEEQQRFRAEVSAWLDANTPPEQAVGAGSPSWEQLRPLRLALGEMGWLAPSTPLEQGGAGLTSDHNVVVMEELDRRGLLSVYDAAATQLRSALQDGGSERLRDDLLPALSSGSAIVWTAVLDAHAEPGGDTLGVSARPDADGFSYKSAHTWEFSLAFAGPEAFPLSLFAGLINDDDKPMYLEAGLPLPAGEGMELGLHAGMVTAASGFYDTEGAAVVNLGITAGKELQITESFALPMSVSYVINPDQDRAFLVFGISLAP